MSDEIIRNGKTYVYSESRGAYVLLLDASPEMPAPISTKEPKGFKYCGALAGVVRRDTPISVNDAVAKCVALHPGASPKNFEDAIGPLDAARTIVVLPPRRPRAEQVLHWLGKRDLRAAPSEHTEFPTAAPALTPIKAPIKVRLSEYVRSRGDDAWQPLQPVIDEYNRLDGSTGHRTGNRAQLYGAEGIVIDREAGLFRLGVNINVMMPSGRNHYDHNND